MLMTFDDVVLRVDDVTVREVEVRELGDADVLLEDKGC